MYKLLKTKDMRNKLIILAIIFSFTFLIIGCSKDDDLVSVIMTPTIEMSTSSTSIAFNSDITIIYNIVNATSATLNGEPISLPLSGSKTFTGLKVTTVFVIIANNGANKTATKEISVAVLPLPTITITTQTSGSLPYASKGSFSWTTTDANNVSFGGVNYGPSGSFTTGEIIINTDFTLTITGLGGTITKVVSFPVGDWTTSKIGLLTHSTLWTQIKEEILLSTLNYDTDVWTQFTLSHVYTYRFYLNHKYSFWVEGELAGDQDWVINGDNITIGGQVWTIKELTQTKFVRVLLIQGPAVGAYSYLRQTFTSK